MTASLLFPLPLLWLLLVTALGCGASTRDSSADARHPADALVAVHGDFLADGSCRATVAGVPLFATRDAPRSSLDAGAAADIAPAGYALHQLECALTDDDASLRAGRADAPSVLVTVHARDGAPIHPGRYVVRAGIAEAAAASGDSRAGTTDVASRAGVAIFGASVAGDAAGASGAGVRYLEGREGTLEIISVSGARVVARFDVRAARAWSM